LQAALLRLPIPVDFSLQTVFRPLAMNLFAFKEFGNVAACFGCPWNER
jgi:hypothetical protein